MGQRIESSFVSDGRYRVHMIDAVGRRAARIIEIENVDTGERHHGPGNRLQRLLVELCHSHAEENQISPR